MDNPISGIAPEALEHVIAHLRAEYPDDAVVLDRLLAHLKATRPTMAEIKEAVCEFYRLTPVELCSHCREPHIATARQILCYLTYKHTRLSMKGVGKRVGGHDHTTVAYAIRKIETQILNNKSLICDELDQLRMRIAEKVLLRRRLAC